ncbi:MAG: hydantoinase/oxoprolinase family protein [Bacilli bacterium]
MTTIGLGIDTGGTYTDAVLLDMQSAKILNKSKALTTRENLVIGIRGAIGLLDQEILAKTSIVSLSSTLATNSIVEGKGCRVGVICIGQEFDGKIVVDACANLEGGHNLEGGERHPLDDDAVRTALLSMKGKIDCLAVTAFLSVRNPEHENRVADMAQKLLGIPTVCGHVLSSSLGFNERTNTAIMNARLIPVIADLISSVKEVMKEFKLRAPLMIVKGDGTIMSDSMAAERPVETILSGPASSLMGAKATTRLKDAIMIDVGGTTTDIGVLRDGFPRLDPEGAIIGGHRTRVRAAAVTTFGLGGDSRFVVNGRDIHLTELRVIPICIAASRWPRIRQSLKTLADTFPSRAAQSFRMNEIIQDDEFFIASRPVRNETIQDCDRKLLQFIAVEPYTLKEASDTLGIHAFLFDVARLEELGLVQRIGVTPTDLLHCEGSYVEYDREASQYALKYLSTKADIPIDAFVAMCKQMVINKIARDLMTNLICEDLDTDKLQLQTEKMVDMAITGRQAKDFKVGIKLTKPIVGIGAPVSAWLPPVAKIFGTDLVINDDSDVGNAVGAVSGSISEMIVITIQPMPGEMGADPACRIFASFGNAEKTSLRDAIAYAEENGKREVLQKARASGALDPVVSCDVNKHIVKSAADGTSVFLEATVTVTATGKPAILIDEKEDPEELYYRS